MTTTRCQVWGQLGQNNGKVTVRWKKCEFSSKRGWIFKSKSFYVTRQSFIFTIFQKEMPKMLQKYAKLTVPNYRRLADKTLQKNTNLCLL